jgi:SAM-dependent methyltransferase
MQTERADQGHAARVAALRAALGEGEDPSRTRSLPEIDDKLRAVGTPLVAALEQQLERGRPVSVLEIGFGWGAVLVELAWRFREAPAEFAGVNLEPEPPVERAEDLAVVAEALDIVPAAEIPRFRLPAVHFYDATTLRFADESLDVVYSAVTIRFIEDKARLVEEVARTLRPGGRALLHIGEAGWEYPAGPATDPAMLTPHPCRMVLHRDLELVPLQDHLTAAGGDRFTICVPTGRRCVIDVTRRASGPLDLGLELDRERTIPMRAFPHPRPKGAGGIRSAYRIVAR